MTANLSGAYLATHHSLPLLAEDAHLVFLGAVSERLRLPGLSAYAAAKAGLEAFGEALGKEAALGIEDIDLIFTLSFSLSERSDE